MHNFLNFVFFLGNVLAEHLAQCERQTAYISEEQAKANTVAVSTTKHGMMDSLGLQRNKDSEYVPHIPQVFFFFMNF